MKKRWALAEVRGDMRAIQLIWLTACAFSLSTCAARTRFVPPLAEPQSTPASAKEQARHSRRVRRPVEPQVDHLVVMMIDGVRWQDIWEGPDRRFVMGNTALPKIAESEATLLPNLTRLARERGILIGGEHSRLSVSSPHTISLPSYSELFAGRPPSCESNECPSTNETTFLDTWLQFLPTAKLAVISSWSAIPRVAARKPGILYVSAGRSHNARFESLLGDVETNRLYARGASATAAPGTDDYRPDVHTAELALSVLDKAAPDFLFLGLGDTDEYAHQNQYGRYLMALNYADSIIGRVDSWLLKQESLGRRTLFVVATDHGRANTFVNHGNTPEAARIWALMSGSVVKTRGRPRMPDALLSDLAPTFRHHLGLMPDYSPSAGRDLTATLLTPEGAITDEGKTMVSALQSTMSGPGGVTGLVSP